MSYFNNDHLQINNIIIDFEENIGKISSINQILNSIENFDEFIELKNQLKNLFTDIENDTNTLINTLKIIQYNIRKLYDDFSLLQNNYEDIEEKLKMIINDNNILINKNKEINEEIESKNQMIMEQDNYINKLFDILKNNENIIKYQNNNDIKNKTVQTKGKHKNIVNSCETSIENTKKYPVTHLKHNMRKNNSMNFKKPDKNNILSNNIKEPNMINNYSKKNNESISNDNLNKNISINDKNISNSMLTGKYIFKDDFEQDEEDNIHNNNINNKKQYSKNNNNIKNRIEKVEKIISIVYKDNNLYSKLKEKYGDDLENKIINENVSMEFLDEILKDIFEFTVQKTNESNKINIIPNKKEKNNINEINLNYGKATTDKHKRTKDMNYNFFQNNEPGSKLTNYFLFNLHREKMIDSQQQKKNYIRPKTPKL